MKNQKVYLSQVREGDLYKSLSDQVFQVLKVDLAASTITVKALTNFSGPGSARSQKVGEVRTLVNAHQWCGRMTRYKPDV